MRDESMDTVNTRSTDLTVWLQDFDYGLQKRFFQHVDFLDCPVCRDCRSLFYIVCEQGHSFCNMCIKEMEDRCRIDCPTCRTPMLTVPIRDRTKDQWKENIVRPCLFPSCPWKGTYHEWVSHLYNETEDHSLPESWTLLELNQRYDILDKDGEYHVGEITFINQDQEEISIHFFGWDGHFDQTLKSSEYPGRFAPLHTWTKNMTQLLTVGQTVDYRMPYGYYYTFPSSEKNTTMVTNNEDVTMTNESNDNNAKTMPLRFTNAFHVAFSSTTPWKSGRIQFISNPLVHMRVLDVSGTSVDDFVIPYQDVLEFISPVGIHVSSPPVDTIF